MQKNTIFKDFPHFLIGGDYNPEQWLETPQILEDDMALMREANCNEMTMGIFSWDRLEPQEGVFDFSWLDERMDAIYANGGRVILATPSAACPRWMNDIYPDMGVVTAEGYHTHFSRRQNRCLNHKGFRKKVRIINEKLAEHYADHPALLGWHLSNEYRGLECFCPECIAKFRQWCRSKYDDAIQKLNQEWWTGFWSHRYDSFEQIIPPNAPCGEASITGLTLDWRRFLSDTVIDFVGLECESIRKFSKKPITTNCMGFFERYDHHKMVRHLDFYSNDSYPGWWNGINDETIADTAAYSALCRCMKKGKPYILMESAPGTNIWMQEFNHQKSTELQIFEAMLHTATGADSVLYFQWRKGRGGAEKYHGAIVDHYGKSDNRVFQSVRQIGEILQKMDGIVGTGIRSQVAVIRDYETIWALNGNPRFTLFHKDINGYDNLVLQAYGACWNKNIAADIVGYDAVFEDYKVLILPSPYIMTEPLSEKIRKFVKNGGIVVSFCLAAMANENDLAHLGGTPGCGLTELFGFRVDEMTYYGRSDCIYDNEVVYATKTYPVKKHAEVLIPSHAQTLAEYRKDYFSATPAVTVTDYGKGKAYYVAFYPDRKFTQDFLGDVLADAGIHGIQLLKGNSHLRITCREGNGEKYYFVLNGSAEPQKVTINSGDEKLWDILRDTEPEDHFTLPPLGVTILKELQN